MATALIVGASGNIGVAAITAALRSKLNVLAIVRNQTSADKLFKHVGTRNGIMTVEADVTSENGVKGVVDQVKAGKLPSFQHVYAAVGVWESTMPLQNIDTATFRRVMSTNVEANFFAYRATMPYLIEQNKPDSTWTLITGGAGEMGFGGVTAVSQGALFTMANAASRENEKTNVRFNEVYLNYRVDFDEVAEEKGDKNIMKASDFARNYEQILTRPDVRGCRVTVENPGDLDNLNFRKKIQSKY